jgi:ketosteroid isomerase-like protein
MSDLQAIADRVEIEALRGEFTDAGMMRDFDRFASLFTHDAVWRIPVVNVEFVGREEIRAGIERLGEGLWDYLVQTTHPGAIQLEGDTASGRAYVLSFGHMRDGSSHLNYSVYHDRYRRTRKAGSSPNAPTRSSIWTPLRWRARRPSRLAAALVLVPCGQATGPAQGLAEQELDLGVDAAQVVGRPALEGVVDALVDAEQEALGVPHGWLPLRCRGSRC